MDSLNLYLKFKSIIVIGDGRLYCEQSSPVMTLLSMALSTFYLKIKLDGSNKN